MKFSMIVENQTTDKSRAGDRRILEETVELALACERENFDVFDFALSADEVSRIDALDTGVRAGSDPEKFTAASYPADIDNQ